MVPSVPSAKRPAGDARMGVLKRVRCRCGHLDFPKRGRGGHFRAGDDHGAQRSGPCRECPCPRFRVDAHAEEVEA